MANSQWGSLVPLAIPLFAAVLRAPRRRGGNGIIRPWMLRIAPAHLGAHGSVAAAPEAGQVARDLHRPLRRRKKFDRERDLAAGNGRMAVEPEQLLHADCDF